MSRTYFRILPPAATLLLGAAFLGPGSRLSGPNRPPSLDAKLSEWKIELSQSSVPSGPVTFAVANAGSIPHQFEIEGNGIEQRTGVIPPGGSAALQLRLQPGAYEIYCPVGEDSHKKLGMVTHLTVSARTGSADHAQGEETESGDSPEAARNTRAIRVSGGGPVIQILPGPFPFSDSLGAVLPAFGEERASLEAQARRGPYSNKVARISGNFALSAWDKGPVRDSVEGVAEFITQDAARWKLVLDRVQTKDVPHHPRFGGVIMGLYYHGITTVHTPLVPTINSAVALWAIGHLYRDGVLLTDNAMVHVMLLSHTRRDGDFALACWNCSKNKVDELQLQVTPAPGEPQFKAPGGFLFLNWEKSVGQPLD
jgi:hypothetical protein